MYAVTAAPQTQTLSAHTTENHPPPLPPPPLQWRYCQFKGPKVFAATHFAKASYIDIIANTLAFSPCNVRCRRHFNGPSHKINAPRVFVLDVCAIFFFLLFFSPVVCVSCVCVLGALSAVLFVTSTEIAAATELLHIWRFCCVCWSCVCVRCVFAMCVWPGNKQQ